MGIYIQGEVRKKTSFGLLPEHYGRIPPAPSNMSCWKRPEIITGQHTYPNKVGHVPLPGAQITKLAWLMFAVISFPI